MLQKSYSNEFSPFQDFPKGIKSIYFKSNGQEIGTLHTGRRSWFGTKNRILAAKQFICIRKVKMPETFYDISSGTRNSIWIRIIFTKIFSNKVLIGGMTARIYR